MLSLEYTFKTIFQLFSYISPFLLGFFLIVSSIFNQDLKGLIYLAGVLIATMINIPIMQMINNTPPTNSDGEYDINGSFCNIVNWTGNKTIYRSPSSSLLFIAFTATYLILPMRANNNANYAVVVFLMSVLGIDWVTKVKSGCTTNSGAALGVLLGYVFALIWYTMLFQGGYKSLLYFNTLNSNRLMCSRPSEQTFKCSVYKNGQLVSSNIV